MAVEGSSIGDSGGGDVMVEGAGRLFATDQPPDSNTVTATGPRSRASKM